MTTIAAAEIPTSPTNPASGASAAAGPAIIECAAKVIPNLQKARTIIKDEQLLAKGYNLKDQKLPANASKDPVFIGCPACGEDGGGHPGQLCGMMKKQGTSFPKVFRVQCECKGIGGDCSQCLLCKDAAAAAGKHLCQAMLSLGVKDPVVLRAHCPGAEDGATCAYCFASGPECDQCTVCMCACGSATPYVLIPDGQVIIHPRGAQSSLRAHNPLSSSHFPLPENIRSLLLFSLL